VSDIAPNALPAAPAVNPSSFRREGDHVRMPQEVAAGHPLYGVGGWLVALAVLLILDAVFNGLSAIASLILSDRLPNGGLVLFFGFVQAGFCIWMINCLVMLFGKNPGFPRQLTTLCIFSLGGSALTVLLGGFHWSMLVQATLICVYLTYVQSSVRVRVTYRNEIAVTDWLLQKTFPDGLPEHLKAGSTAPRSFAGFQRPQREKLATARRAF
jgi:hypothetical protein